MGLNWDVTNVAVIPADADAREAWYEQVSYEQAGGQDLNNRDLVEALIWRSIVLCWGWELTDDKVQTAIKRNAMYERLCQTGNPKFYTFIPPAFIADMVGFRSNVSAETDAAFMKRVRQWAEEYAAAVYRDWVTSHPLLDEEAAHDDEIDRSVAEHEIALAAQDEEAGR